MPSLLHIVKSRLVGLRFLLQVGEQGVGKSTIVHNLFGALHKPATPDFTTTPATATYLARAQHATLHFNVQVWCTVCSSWKGCNHDKLAGALFPGRRFVLLVD